MVSFSCEACGDVVTKKSLDKHRNQCRGASFTCLDCMQHFHGTTYKSHTSCISEAQKYQGSLYREKDNKKNKRQSVVGQESSTDMVPRRAYVEDAPEGDDSQALVEVIDVPPKAPTPPPPPAPASDPVGELPDGVNVFDFLVSEDTPKAVEHTPHEQRMVEHPQHYGNGDYSQWSQYSNGTAGEYLNSGFAYGNAPVPPSTARYDSWQHLTESQAAQAIGGAFVTPAPKEQRRERRDKRVTISETSEKKRKRHQVEDLDVITAQQRPSSRDATMTDAPNTDPRVLHSGLTGGLSKLVTDPEFYEDRIDAGPTPVLSPLKRSRREADDAKRKADRRASSYAEYDTVIVKPSNTSAAPSSKHTPSVDRRRHDEDRRKYHDDDKMTYQYTTSKESSKSRPRRERSPTYHDDVDRRTRHRRERSPEQRKPSISTSTTTTTYQYHDDARLRPSARPQTTSAQSHARDSLSSEDLKPSRKHLRAIEYQPSTSTSLTTGPIDRPASVQPSANNQMVTYSTRADLFLSFITKGPDSERGCSINKVLKRYHREREVRGDSGARRGGDRERERERDEDDKELWKALRLRRNDRGEIVLFL